MKTERQRSLTPVIEDAPKAGPVVRIERLLPHPPRRVWRALTRPEAICHWLLPISGSEAPEALDAPGAAVRLRPSPERRIAYEVAEAEPERRLSLWWRVTPAPADRLEPVEAIPTRVTWTLTPEQDGAATRLVIEHTAPRNGQMMSRSAAPLSGAIARLSVYLTLGQSRRTRRRHTAGRADRFYTKGSALCRLSPMSSSRMPAASAVMISTRVF